MSAKRKVDLIELQRLYDEGLNGREIARRMGVSEASISKNTHALQLAKTGDIVLRSAIA